MMNTLRPDHDEGSPDLIAIDHDDYHAEFVGRTQDGRQFFLTTPFVPAIDGASGSEYIALYIFDQAGDLIESKIDELGPRETVDRERDCEIRAARLRELGSVSFERIEVKPFAVEKFGITFGLVPRAPESEDEGWAVEAMPGNYMAFFEPWDSGEYDT